MCRVVHLDLKSCNVLIGGDGTAKISGVGLALRIRGQDRSITAPAGTFSWVAPEVILGGTPPAILDSPHFPCILSDHIPPYHAAWRCSASRLPLLFSTAAQTAGEGCTIASMKRLDAAYCCRH